MSSSIDAEIRSFVNVGMEFELRIERKSNSEKNLLGSSGHELPELFRDDLKPQVAKYGLEHRPVFIRPTGAPVELANLFPNQAVFLICNGPSFNIESAAKLQAPGLVTFGMNNGANKFRPKLWACTDDPTRFVTSIWRDPTVLKFVPIQHFEAPISVSGATLRPPLVRDMAAVVGVRKNDDFDPDTWLHEASINWGHDPTFGGPRSTLLFALRICHVLGFRKVYLLGCDFQMTHERAYWFRENCTKEFIEFNNQAYHGLSQLLELLKPRFDEAGFEVYNTNPHSKLTVFPFADLNDAIRRHSVCEEQDTAGMYCRPLRILK